MLASLRKYITYRLLLVITVVAAAVLVSWFWLSPMVSNAVQEHQQIRGEYEAAVDNDKNLAKMESNFSAIEPDLETLLEALPEKNDIFQVIDQLEKIAEQNGLAQTLDVADFSEDIDGLDGIPVQVTLKGNKDAVVKYLENLSNLKYFVSVRDLEYDRKFGDTGSEDQSASGVNAIINIFIFVVPVDK